MFHKNQRKSFQATSLCLAYTHTALMSQENLKSLENQKLKLISRKNAIVENSQNSSFWIFGWIIDGYCNFSSFILDKLGRNPIEEKSVTDKALKHPFNDVIEEAIDIHTYIQRAYSYLKKGDAQMAIEEFNQAIAENPHSAYIYGERANFRQKNLGDCEGAIEDYSQAIYLEPLNALFFLWRSQVYKSLGKYKKSIEDYNTAINLSPNHTICYCFHGVSGRND